MIRDHQNNKQQIYPRERHYLMIINIGSATELCGIVVGV